MRIASDPRFCFDVAKSLYDLENIVPIRVSTGDRNQLFAINADRTVSPIMAPDLCFGYDEFKKKVIKRLILVDRSDTARRIVFKELLNTVNYTFVFHAKLKSHGHKGIMLAERSATSRGIEHFVRLGHAKAALKLSLDNNGYLHLTHRPYQVLDAYASSIYGVRFTCIDVSNDYQKFDVEKESGLICLAS